MIRCEGMPAASARAGALAAERHDRADQVVVLRVRVGNARGQADVGRDDGRARRCGDGEVLRVCEAADVVADHRADGERGLGYRRSPRVD